MILPIVMLRQSEDGDIIDCVDIYKQPALDNPLLKNHTIQVHCLCYLVFLLLLFTERSIRVKHDRRCNVCYSMLPQMIPNL